MVPAADHPLAADSQYRREAVQQLQAVREKRRYDAAKMNSLLGALISGEVPARQGWWEIVAYLHRTPEATRSYQHPARHPCGTPVSV